MTRDFAKTKNQKMTSARSQGKVITFIIGFIAGTLTTYLLYTWQSEDPSVMVQRDPLQPAPETKQETNEKLDFTFQDLFPIEEVKIISGYEQPNPETEEFSFLLQTGSFKSTRDADERRAEILLLGLDAFIESTEINGINWHRVMVGPFSDRQSLSRAQDLLAGNQFEAMPRRAKP